MNVLAHSVLTYDVVEMSVSSQTQLSQQAAHCREIALCDTARDQKPVAGTSARGKLPVAYMIARANSPAIRDSYFTSAESSLIG